MSATLVVYPTVKPEWDSHREQWQDCKRCSLGERSANRCLYRGQLPCDVLFVGEGPGVSEDCLGYPFVGPAGQLLDEWIELAELRKKKLMCGFTNVTACRPCDTKTGPNRPPDAKESECCEPRLKQIIKIASPQWLIAVGQFAEWFLIDGELVPTSSRTQYMLAIAHPASALRDGGLRSRKSKTAIEILKVIGRE